MFSTVVLGRTFLSHFIEIFHGDSDEFCQIHFLQLWISYGLSG